MRKPGLYGEERECYVCGSPYVECHHIYGGVGRRPISDREGCWVYLCREHHQGRTGVHRDPAMMRTLREDCERRWCAANGKTPDDFRKVFGVNYIDEETMTSSKDGEVML